jgi:ribosomal protein S27AE
MEAEPRNKASIVTRKLSECRYCGDLIYMEEWSDRWKHNKNGTYRCDGRVLTFHERREASGSDPDE